MRHSAGSNFTGEYLGEYETEFENILGLLIWGLGIIDWRKNEGQKSRDTVPLMS
jgi:hypothetical protein